MRVLTWTIRFVIFLFLAAAAAKNVEPVTLRFFFDTAVQAPLVVALFAAFALGVLLGMLALLGTLLRQRREIGVLKKQNTPELPPQAPPL